ncbi:hypothetical protein FHS39_003768 [Streptomyces olivoverticillatus]|uniref:Secreted protein n=1 Tax=Streptomyces olivoverticillatus TaxID=66427 RepID=A0A7W7PND1_9ACTN|nr:hypothetical protein [Streptomyces olivoverticillatus]MBB4894710.1 hypothetical protein [Streptomyces olivoverticillatus]
MTRKSVAAMTALILAAAVTVTVSAYRDPAPEPAGGGAGAPTTVHDGGPDAASYWTPERMREARPADMGITPADDGHGAGERPSAGNR